MKTRTFTIAPVIVYLITILCFSAPCHAEPGQVILKEDGNVCMINSQGWIIRQYPVASSPHNLELQVYNNLIYVLRKNYQVFVFDMEGKTQRQYFVDSKAKVWVR
jgi:hypothetical protein